MSLRMAAASASIGASILLSSRARAQSDPNGANPNSPGANASSEMKKKSPPPVAPQDAAAMMKNTGGSLMQATMVAQPDAAQARLSDVSFFAVPDPEPRVMRKHDLITIIVREESEAKSEGTSDLKKSADFDAKLDSFVNFSMKNFALRNSASTTPELKTEGTRDFKGEATVDRQDSLTARITAEVVDVKPNGTLVLQARKRMKTDDEMEQFILTGICRAEDILPDNTILSTQLYDLSLDKSHKGEVRDTTKRGWIPKLLDAINPF